MKQVEERYISLLTDFGFKRIFGTAINKDLLICFLNSLFNGRQVVKDVKYLNPEHVGDVYTDRRAIFDVYCEGENGEKFIVEMQNAYQTYFKDRALFYSTFPIREQAPKGSDWDFKLNHVYTVALLNFSMNEDAFDKEKIRHHVQLCDTATHKVFYDKLEYIYVEISKFNKPLEELDTLYEKWLYALKNLYKLTQRPKELCDKVFDRLFEEPIKKESTVLVYKIPFFLNSGSFVRKYCVHPSTACLKLLLEKMVALLYPFADEYTPH